MHFEIDSVLILITLLVAIMTYVRTIPLPKLVTARKRGDLRPWVAFQIIILSVLDFILAIIPLTLILEQIFLCITDVNIDYWILWVLAVAAFAFLCLHTILDWRRIRNMNIHRGNSEQDVRDMLGNPLASVSVGNKLFLIYQKDKIIILEDGKVKKVK